MQTRSFCKIVSSGIFWYKLLVFSKFISSFKPVFALLRLFFILWWDVCIYLLASAVTLFVKNDSSILFIFFLDIWNIFWTTKKSPWSRRTRACVWYFQSIALMSRRGFSHHWLTTLLCGRYLSLSDIRPHTALLIAVESVLSINSITTYCGRYCTFVILKSFAWPNYKHIA